MIDPSAANLRQILDKLNDLHKQATVERSHYYVGSVAKEAADMIRALNRLRPVQPTKVEGE